MVVAEEETSPGNLLRRCKPLLIVRNEYPQLYLLSITHICATIGSTRLISLLFRLEWIHSAPSVTLSLSSRPTRNARRIDVSRTSLPFWSAVHTCATPHLRSTQLLYAHCCSALVKDITPISNLYIRCLLYSNDMLSFYLYYYCSTTHINI